MRKLLWSKASRRDIEQIRDYLDEIDAQFYGRLTVEIVAAARFIEERPHGGPQVTVSGHRKWPVKRTPYFLFYRVLENQIRIVRVLHGASDWSSLL